MMLHAKSSILLAVLAATASPVFGQNDHARSSPVLRGRDSDRELSSRERSVDGVRMRTHASRTAKKNDQRIVGGEQSKPGDFPYFVEMGGCGGALIAPDIVLFAAHCGNWKNNQVNVGSYTKYTTAHNSQPRFCDKWVGDPLYNANTLDYDFALCKLDSPVDFDQSFVKLELNTDNNFPSAQSDLIVMGHGATSEGGSSANDLRNVTVPSLSNTECQQYYGSGITDNMICAGFPGVGERDSCQGDSGGPIIQRQYMNDGTFLDYHVGVVSWGEGCARPGYPGVYARTSKRIDWIQSTACGLGSVASFCPNPPPSCNTGQELTVEVTTDQYSIQENFWQLTQNNNVVMERRFLVRDYASTQKVCLEPDTCYNWEITDSYGDGITENGSYKLTLNNQVVDSGAGNTIGSGKTVEVCTGNGTPTPPTDPPTFAPVVQPTLAPVQNPDTSSCGGNTKVQFRVELQTDNFGIDVQWWVQNRDTSATLFYGTNYGDNMKYILPSATEFYCLEESQCYKFEVFDAYGDGLSDGSTGYIRAILDGKAIKTFEGNYGSLVSHDFCVDASNVEPTPPPTPTPAPNPPLTPPPTPTGSETNTETTTEIDDANTDFPTKAPTPNATPTTSPPTASPTASPSASPSASPTPAPTPAPTPSPTASPTPSPTASPTPGASEETTSSTTDSCEDNPDFRFQNKKKKNCKWLSKQKKKKRKKFCKKKHKMGKEKGRVFDFCAKTCGEIGLGECATKKGKMVTISI